MTSAPPVDSVLASDCGIVLRPDPTRVVVKLFVAGREDVGPGDSRAVPVIDRILSLSEDEIDIALADVETRFDGRHRDLDATFLAHAAIALSRIGLDVELSPARRRLLGAAFTHEYSIESAALCNPSIVAHPEQDDSGNLAFVMSARGVGEGHRSSIGFRTGTISATGEVVVDSADPCPQITDATAGLNHRSVLHMQLAGLGDDTGNAAFLLDDLAPQFSDAELERRIDALEGETAMRRNTAVTIANVRSLKRSSYCTTFPPSTSLSERVLWPQSPAESHGMEDARFVRFVDDDGTASYLATYTAFDGSNIAQHLLVTDDFRSFAVTAMAGLAAVGKGLALFPRRVAGRYVALSRADRESNAIAFSDDLRCWDSAVPIQTPRFAWEILQLGNCGSPIETEEGWLVLTHGVGPMRTYAIGALLLDLDHPERVIAYSKHPILNASATDRDGYVPNVVYTCGALAHGDTLVVPYGVADHRIQIATFRLGALLASFERAEAPTEA